MKGTYILIMKLKNDVNIVVGKLGKVYFKKGFYYYVGSAFGKTINLENRVERYDRLNKERKGNLKWHIDYFLVNPDVKIIDVVVFPKKSIECKVSKKLSKVSKKVVKRFGSSDCKCEGHLYFLDYLNTNFKYFSNTNI